MNARLIKQVSTVIVGALLTVIGCRADEPVIYGPRPVQSLSEDELRKLPSAVQSMWHDIESGIILGRNKERYVQAIAQADWKKAGKSGVEAYYFSINDERDVTYIFVAVHRASGTIIDCGTMVFRGEDSTTPRERW